MIRRFVPATPSRVRRSVVLAAGTLLAGIPLLTACGTPHAGAAAVVGDDQITVSVLQNKVSALRKAQSALPNGQNVVEQSGNVLNSTLYSMILNQVVGQAAKDFGVSVSRADLQQFRREQENAFQGPEALKQLLLQQQGVAAGEIDSFLRTQLTVQRIAERLGVSLTTPQGQQQVTQTLAKTSKDLGVQVNPRFGKWNVDKLTIDSTTEPWLVKPQPPTPPAPPAAPNS